jgi:GntR family transcriptional regulator, histidine utilization repressor
VGSARQRALLTDGTPFAGELAGGTLPAMPPAKRRPPRHRQIRDSILAQVRSGALRPGDRIRSENELASEFHVSRLTVQRAVRDLVAEGLLRRVQGSGTFLNAPGGGFPLVEVRDLVEEIRARGGEPHSDVLIQRRIAADNDLRPLLELAEGAEVFQAAIVQYMDDVPVAYEERFAVPEVYADFLEQDFSRISVFQYFASRSVLEDIENVVRAVMPDKRVAQLLEIAADDPCIHLQRRNWWQGKAVTLTRITYAGSRQALSSRYRPIGR